MKNKAIGKIEKLSVKHFRKPGKKLYLVPLLISVDKKEKSMPEDYLTKIETYWREVKNRIEDLQAKLGEINKIYHELIDVGEKKGLEAIKNLSKKSYQITRTLSQKGAVLEAVEDGDLVRESMDWARCLAIYPQSERAIRKISQFYVEVMQKRDAYITKRIDDTLKDVLDDIHRCLRDFQSEKMGSEKGKAKNVKP
jgi:gas vesicle protein